MNKKLDPELLAYFYDIKSKITSEHKDYFQKHPEIRQILVDFLIKLLLTKPVNIYTFAYNYFHYFEKKTLTQSCKHLLIVGPPFDEKSSLIRLLIDTFPQYFEHNLILTSKNTPSQNSLRKNEKYVTQAIIDDEMALGNLINVKKIGTWMEGTSKNHLNEVLHHGKVCVIKMDIASAKKLVETNSNFNIILLIPGSLEKLKERLLNKGKADVGNIDEVMGVLKHELEESSKLHIFNKRILNITLERSFEQLVCILKFFYKNFNF